MNVAILVPGMAGLNAPVLAAVGDDPRAVGQGNVRWFAVPRPPRTPGSAAAVKLNEPVSTVTPSMTMNLSCMMAYR